MQGSPSLQRLLNFQGFQAWQSIAQSLSSLELAKLISSGDTKLFRQIQLYVTEYYGPWYPWINYLTSLRTLNLADDDTVIDQDLSLLPPNVQEFEAKDVYRLTDKGIAYLPESLSKLILSPAPKAVSACFKGPYKLVLRVVKFDPKAAGVKGLYGTVVKKGTEVTEGMLAITPFVVPTLFRPSKIALIEPATSAGSEISFDL